MKKIIFGFAFLCALTISSCGNGNKKTTETVEQVTVETVDTVATEVLDSVVIVKDETVETEKVEETL